MMYVTAEEASLFFNSVSTISANEEEWRFLLTSVSIIPDNVPSFMDFLSISSVMAGTASPIFQCLVRSRWFHHQALSRPSTMSMFPEPRVERAVMADIAAQSGEPPGRRRAMGQQAIEIDVPGQQVPVSGIEIVRIKIGQSRHASFLSSPVVPAGRRSAPYWQSRGRLARLVPPVL